jgi:hypothetical protein
VTAERYRCVEGYVPLVAAEKSVPAGDSAMSVGLKDMHAFVNWFRVKCTMPGRG